MSKYNHNGQMDITKEELTFSETGDAIYTVQIKDFHRKMKNWAPACVIQTKPFRVQDVDLCLRIYPNGDHPDVHGNVSVYLRNCIQKPIFVNYKLQLGGKSELEGKSKCPLMPEKGIGFTSLCNHVSEYPRQKQMRDEDLKVSCTIVKLTTNKLAWDSYFDFKAKLEETNAKLYECKRKQDETQAELIDAKNKLAKMDTNLEEAKIKIGEMRDINKVKKPPCPICFEEMSQVTKIAQCKNGHLICWSCKEKMVKTDCPSCGLPVDGRAFGMESYLRSLFGFE